MLERSDLRSALVGDLSITISSGDLAPGAAAVGNEAGDRPPSPAAAGAAAAPAGAASRGTPVERPAVAGGAPGPIAPADGGVGAALAPDRAPVSRGTDDVGGGGGGGASSAPRAAGAGGGGAAVAILSFGAHAVAASATINPRPPDLLRLMPNPLRIAGSEWMKCVRLCRRYCKTRRAWY